MTSIAFHLPRLTSKYLGVNREQLLKHDYRDVRFAAHRHRTLPLCRGAALGSILPAGSLIAPGMRIRGLLRELGGAVRTRDLVLHRGMSSWCRTHGVSIGLGLLERAGVFGEAATETWRTSGHYARLAFFPRLCKLPTSPTSATPQWPPFPASLTHKAHYAVSDVFAVGLGCTDASQRWHSHAFAIHNWLLARVVYRSEIYRSHLSAWSMARLLLHPFFHLTCVMYLTFGDPLTPLLPDIP